MNDTFILGAGMAGYGAAYRLHSEMKQATIFEWKSYIGGHTASSYAQGFTFDEGPHISFTKDERIQKLFAENVSGEYEALQAQMNNYWKGHWIKHPAQCNLFGLPTDLVTDILRDFINSQNSDNQGIRTYADWLNGNFGKTFAETFPMEYGIKYHTVAADQLTTDWLAPRFYRPNLEEVLRGALSPQTPDVHYITHFRYPKKNGFVSYLNQLGEISTVHLDHKLIALDPKSHELHFSGGKKVPYKHLISSIPLPELVPMIQGVPNEVGEAVNALACSMGIMVNVGLARADISESHVSYFYDQEIRFSRLSFPHMFSSNNTPVGCGSIQAEIYFSKKYRPCNVEPSACIEPVISDLRKCGLLREDDNILYKDAKLIPYCNVIFDHDRVAALSIVHGYLDDLGIAYCGRYGEWGYHWTDEAFKSGEDAAQKILNRETSPSYPVA